MGRDGKLILNILEQPEIEEYKSFHQEKRRRSHLFLLLQNVQYTPAHLRSYALLVNPILQERFLRLVPFI